jgi:hypothetical protein
VLTSPFFFNPCSQLQQDKRKQRSEIEELRREKGLWESQNAMIKKELQGLKAQLEETEWSMCQKVK